MSGHLTVTTLTWRIVTVPLPAEEQAAPALKRYGGTRGAPGPDQPGLTKAKDEQQELVALRAINEELRVRIALVHSQYIALAKEIIDQFEKFDRATRSAMLDKEGFATLE